MKTQRSLLVTVAALVAVLAGMVSAQAEIPEGVGFTVGYRGIKLNDSAGTFVHNTHPNDWFLPGASTPGSAGQTSIDGELLHFCAIGFRLQHVVVPERVSFNFDVGGLIGWARDEHQNANDPRWPGNAAFVYSKAQLGAFTGIGVAYHLKSLPGVYVGANVEVSCVMIDHGYDRYDKDESVKREFLFIPAFAPKIGWGSKEVFLEVSLSLAKSPGGSVSIGLLF